MPTAATRMVISDPESFHLLTTDMKEMIIKGAIATVNTQAALTRKNAVKIVQDNFTLRNNFTTSQIQFQQMPQTRFIALEHITSRVGITERAGYMARQETGGVRKNESGNNLAIPTNRARGGNRGSPVLKNNYLSKLKKLQSAGGGHAEAGSHRAWLVRKAYIAAKHGLVMRYNNRLFTVQNFEKSGGRVSFKMNQIYGLNLSETVTPQNEWLWKASEKPAADAENIFISQMKKLGM